ncbi:hypothetical protein [Stutzerimonas stutzeri]|uniref:hypothetical protein n=1 Tax=Stutzerimonas stutzeri TaxID=316 RepID=UPI003C6EDF52
MTFGAQPSLDTAWHLAELAKLASQAIRSSSRCKHWPITSANTRPSPGPRNLLSHFIGIPMIVLAVAALLSRPGV